MIADSKTEESAATDANAYLRSIPVAVYKGSKIMADGYSLKLYRVNGSVLTELKAGEGEVAAIDTDNITLDLRVVEKANYIIKAVIESTGRVAPQIQFSVARIYPSYDCRPTNGTDINVRDEYRLDVAQVSCNGKVVDCPEAAIAIRWCTDTAAKERVVHNEGKDTKFKLSDTGIGSTYEDDWLDVYTESEIRPVYAAAVSENGDSFINENGDNLIIN